MEQQSLIPSFEAEQLHKVDLVAADVASKINDENQVIKNLANPLTCESKFLPYLAYSLKVDFWDENLDEQSKRNLIKRSILLHRRKGTLWAIEEVLDLVGFTDRRHGFHATIKEGLKLNSRDGTYKYSAIYNHGSSADWAKYVIYVPKAITIQKAQFARKLIEAYAPKRCILVAVVYQVLPNRNGTYFYNNEITHGSIGVANG